MKIQRGRVRAIEFIEEFRNLMAGAYELDAAAFIRKIPSDWFVQRLNGKWYKSSCLDFALRKSLRSPTSGAGLPSEKFIAPGAVDFLLPGKFSCSARTDFFRRAFHLVMQASGNRCMQLLNPAKRLIIQKKKWSERRDLNPPQQFQKHLILKHIRGLTNRTIHKDAHTQ